VKDKFKDVRMAFESWYVIDGDEHLKMGSFSDACALMGARSNIQGNKHLIMMSEKEYSNWPKRKTKRGKNS
jgi:hypothetical protein